SEPEQLDFRRRQLRRRLAQQSSRVPHLRPTRTEMVSTGYFVDFHSNALHVTSGIGAKSSIADRHADEGKTSTARPDHRAAADRAGVNASLLPPPPVSRPSALRLRLEEGRIEEGAFLEIPRCPSLPLPSSSLSLRAEGRSTGGWDCARYSGSPTSSKHH